MGPVVKQLLLLSGGASAADLCRAFACLHHPPGKPRRKQ